MRTTRLAVVTALIASVHIAHAQPAAKAPARTAAIRAKAAGTAEPAAAELPVTRVALYKNGVGFFEHSGHVTGNGSVTIDFTTAQLNDVLQSLTAIDLNGGRIAGAGYNSTTPLDQQLKSLPLGLGKEATFSALFNALRGTHVEVVGSGAPFTGRVMSEEMHKTGPGKDQTGMLEGRFLTVASDSGEVRIFQLTPTLTVRLLDTAAHTDLTRYLQLLDSSRDQGLRHLTLEDNGSGTRELRVSYISEVPVWKSTYRILFTEPAKGSTAKTTATLQGWSVVDNTTGADWNNVQLSLIAGAPQSFIQPLSVPYYSRRPEIALPQEAQLTPQTHESGDAALALPKPTAPPQGQVAGLAGFAAGGVMGDIGSGVGAGSGGNYGGGARRIGNGVSIDALSDDSESNASATIITGASYQTAAANSFNARGTGTAFDDYFEYKIGEPITIRKNESAMVPILQEKIGAERVTLWAARQPTPLRALWMTNTSNLTLDRGSFSIVEDGNFGGEGLLDPIHPGEKRLLSYAVDQAVRVTTESNSNSSRVTSITGAKGVIQLHETRVAEITYLVHNAASDSRTVIVEHPIRNGYTLDSDPKPEETTPNAYRFRVGTAPGETVRLHVGERGTTIARYTLSSSNDNILTVILNQTGNNPAVKQALAPILDARRKVADMQSAVDTINNKLTGLRSDEERQRANVTALANTDKSSRERFVHELNATEDQIAIAQKDLAASEASLKAAKDDLANKIETIQIDEKL